MKTILVVDDEFSIVETLGEILTWEGYVVVTAPNGRAALTLLATERPALVLLDYMMPVLDGLQTLASIRGDDRLKNIPVVLMTAAPQRVLDAEPLWNVLLRKPFDVDALLAIVAELAGPPG